MTHPPFSRSAGLGGNRLQTFTRRFNALIRRGPRQRSGCSPLLPPALSRQGRIGILKASPAGQVSCDRHMVDKAECIVICGFQSDIMAKAVYLEIDVIPAHFPFSPGRHYTVLHGKPEA